MWAPKQKDKQLVSPMGSVPTVCVCLSGRWLCLHPQKWFSEIHPSVKSLSCVPHKAIKIEKKIPTDGSNVWKCNIYL